MASSSKTLFIVLGVVTVAFAAYYFIAQRSTLEPSVSESSLQLMLNRTQAFIEYRQTLDQITFDFSIFEDDRFRTLRSYSQPVEQKPEGRPNPFAPVGSDSGSVTAS
jgi:hypothetical protein